MFTKTRSIQVLTKLYLLCCLYLVVRSHDVDYFVNLISEGRKSALNYKLPKSALEYKSSPAQHYFGEYDYIIVGAGTSGSVIANRLSERHDWRILVIEAGVLENNFTNIPAMRYATEFTHYNWGYKSIPQKNACLGMVNKTCPISRGKGVGGTTLINGLIYDRPSHHDFERWEAEGNPGWSYEEVLPYFKKSEKSNIPDGDKGFHGHHGELNVEYRVSQSPHLKAFLKGNAELSRPILDYNGKSKLGVSQTQHNTLLGVRQSNGAAFIQPALHRNNLKLLVNTYVTRILIDDENCAKGVEFSHNHKIYVAKATHEIIIAAGAIGSPQILQLSGIGPKDLLKKNGIPVVADLPVGKHLTDQPMFYGLHFRTSYSEPILSMKNYVKQYLNGVGPLTYPGNNQGLGFYRTPLARIPHTPDLELIIFTANNTDEFTPRRLNFRKDTTKALLGDSNPSKELTITPTLLQPLSEGTVEIVSKNPFEYPKIDPNFLANPYDVDSLYTAVQSIFELVSTLPFKKLKTEYSPKSLPACHKYKFLSKEYWYCALRQVTLGCGNLGGTCRMGPHPKNAVVDHRLNVYGVYNLRVADASVFPFPLSAADYSATITMVGERVAEFIKEDHNSYDERYES